MLQYAKSRRKNANFASDVYDCKAWQRRMELVKAWPDDDCIMLLICIDAIAAFKNGGMSLMPAEFMILNLPPQFRSKPDYMFLSLLIPAHLKATAQKRYFDYLVDTELNPLATTGFIHPRGRARVLVFSSTLDLPGRDKFFRLRGNDDR